MCGIDYQKSGTIVLDETRPQDVLGFKPGRCDAEKYFNTQ